MSITFENEVAVLIDGNRFRFWNTVAITRMIDSIHTVSIGAPFEQNDTYFRNTFQPFSFKPLNVTINDDPFFTGTMITDVPQMDPRKTTDNIGAYALPGVLQDCTVPGANLPLEFNGLNLHDIATTLAGYFDIEIDAQVSAGDVFKKIDMDPASKILPFLTPLAQQRGQIMTSNEIGDLVFWEANESGNSVAKLVQGESPLIGISPTFKHDQYYSEITGLKDVRVRSKGSSSFTLENPIYDGPTRPYIYRVTDIEDPDLETAVTNKMSRMFANTVTYTAKVATWRDPQGNIWAPNTFVTVEAPGAKIYSAYNFLVRGVTLRKTSKTETADLHLVLPGSFGEADPGAMPWDE